MKVPTTETVSDDVIIE